MGLFRAFVFFWDRRAVLAVLALGVSLSYALLASATVYGLRDAQSGLGADLEEAQSVVLRTGYEPFEVSNLSPAPDGALAVHVTSERTYYAVRAGPGSIANDTGVVAGSATGLQPGSAVAVNGVALPVLSQATALGASPDWIGVDESTFAALGGAPIPLVNVAVYGELAAGDERALKRAGFIVVEAPATRQFYVAGAEQLVSSIWVTTAASTIVIAIVVSSVLDMEARARHRSLATLRLFAGAGRVRGLLLARATALLAAGQCVGLLATVGLLVLLEKADVAPFHLKPFQIFLVMTTTLVGGLVGTLPGMVRTLRRLRARELHGTSPAAIRPRALRPLLTTWTNFPMLVAAGIVLSGTLSVAFGAAQIPNNIFGVGPDADVIAAIGGNPLRTTVPAFAGLHLHEVDGFDASSPEIFAPVVIDGRPVIVRGVSWEHLGRLDHVDVLRGQAPLAYGEVGLGTRLARQLDIGVGQTVVVPAAYTVSALTLRVSGIVDAPGLLADEALVSLATARALTGLAPQDVNLIRVRTSPDGGPGGVPPIVPEGLEVTNLRLDPPEPVPFETAHAEVDVINFAPQPRTRLLILRVNGEPVADAFLSLPALATTTHSFTFRVPAADLLRVQVNPSIETPPSGAAYRLEAPDRAIVGTDITVTVRQVDGGAAAGVAVRLGNESATSNTEGRATLRPVGAGNSTLLAEGPEGRAARAILVLEPQNVNRTLLILRQVTGPSQIVAGAWTGSIRVENMGGLAHSGPIPLPLNDLSLAINETVVNVGQVDIGPGQQRLLEVRVDLVTGSYRIGPVEGGLLVTVYESRIEGPDKPPDAPATVDELLRERRERATQALGQRRDATAAFLGDTYANLNAALSVVTFATFLHTGLVVAVTVLRGVEARTTNVGALAVLGAGRGDLRRRAVFEHLLPGGAAALVGVVLGLGLAAGGASMGILQGFGHTLQPYLGTTFGLRLVVVTLALVLVAAVVAVEQVRGRSLRRLLVRGPERLEPGDLAHLLGDPRASRK